MYRDILKKGVFAVLFTCIWPLFSCKKTEHTIRFVNNYSSTVTNVQAGNTALGTIDAGQNSAYLSISAGNFDITGQTAGGYLVGNGSITGKGKHHWTITLGADKIMTLTDDN